MSITVNAVVLERRDITESWEATNPILPAGQLGWEFDIYGFPVGVKMGDGATRWKSLKYWFQNTSEPVKVVFSSATGFTVANWQTGIPAGYTSTYAYLCGNLIKQPTVYVGSDGAGYTALTSVNFAIGRTGALITSVAFDWGDTFSGYIQF